VAYNVVIQKINMLGFCCPFSYFYAVRDVSTIDVAKELKVTRRTVRRWRKDYRHDDLRCWKTRNCFFSARPLPEKCPYSRRESVEDLDLALDALRP
jgi:hypothetical protein